MNDARQKALLGDVTAERERALEIAQTAYAEGTIVVEELEQRLERVQAAESLVTIRQAVADLVPLTAPTTTVALMPAHEVPERGLVVSIMGGTEKKGAWVVPRRSFVWTTMGGTDLDYREARFGPGVHEVYVFAMWGGVDITVPHGINVEVQGAGIMGGFGGRGNHCPHPNAPTLRVIGLAIMGGVDVDVRLPGETARQARKRRKEEGKLALQEAQQKRLGPGG